MKPTGKVRLSTGKEIELDGDLVFLVDSLYREIALLKGMEHSAHDVHKEIRAVMAQMTPEQIREYLLHSLFLNYVTYENTMVERLVKKITRSARRQPKQKTK